MGTGTWGMRDKFKFYQKNLEVWIKRLIFAPDIDIVELKRYLLCHAQQETKVPQESTTLWYAASIVRTSLTPRRTTGSLSRRFLHSERLSQKTCKQKSAPATSMHIASCRTMRDTRYRDKRSCHQSMWSAQHLWFPTSDIREKKKCYSRGYAIARCQAKTTLKSYWHELRDHQEYSKKIAMKTGTHTQVPPWLPWLPNMTLDYHLPIIERTENEPKHNLIN